MIRNQDADVEEKHDEINQDFMIFCSEPSKSQKFQPMIFPKLIES